MMMTLLSIKEKMKNIYAEHELIVNPILKFIEAFIALLLIKYNIGYVPVFNMWLVILGLSVICAFLPWALGVVLIAVDIIANVSGVSYELAAFVAILMVLMFIFFFRFTPKQGAFLVLVPLAFFLKIPFIIPIAAGLLFTPTAIVSVSFGTIIYYVLAAVNANSMVISNISSGTDAPTTVNSVINMIGNNKEMFLTLIAFGVTTALVYGIKRLSTDYAWFIAIFAGGAFDFIVVLIGSIVLNTKSSILVVIIGTVVSLILAFALQFFVFSVDYSRTEHTQFEDDEYYYYVKAVPKINVTAPEMNVKRINAQRRKKGVNKMPRNRKN